VVTAHHHLRVVDQVEGEEEGPRPPVHHLHVLRVRDEDHHDAKDHESTQKTDENASHCCKAKIVRARTIPVVIPTAMRTASTS